METGRGRSRAATAGRCLGPRLGLGHLSHLPERGSEPGGISFYRQEDRPGDKGGEWGGRRGRATSGPELAEEG
jgi:hypothetical protein